LDDVDNYLKSRTPAAAWRIVGRHASRCELEVGAQSTNYTVTFQIQQHHGLDRALDIILSEPIIYNPWLCVWPAISPRPDFPDNYIRVDLDPSAGVGAIHYTAGQDDLTGSWITKTSLPVSGVHLTWDYHNADEARFPDDSVIPLDLWRQALHEYFDLLGGRPTCVGWQRTEFRW
jgi:hypothetical protein